MKILTTLIFLTLTSNLLANSYECVDKNDNSRKLRFVESKDLSEAVLMLDGFEVLDQQAIKCRLEHSFSSKQLNIYFCDLDTKFAVSGSGNKQSVYLESYQHASELEAVYFKNNRCKKLQ